MNEQNKNQNNNQQKQLPAITTSNEERNRKVRLGVAVVAIILVLFLAFGFRDANRTAVAPEDPAAEGVETVDLGATAAASSSDTLSYQEAIAQYKGRRVSFDEACKGTKDLTFPIGTQVLVDNIGTTAKTIGFKNRTVNLRPMHYTFTKFYEAGEYTFSCGGDEEAAVVVVK